MGRRFVYVAGMRLCIIGFLLMVGWGMIVRPNVAGGQDRIAEAKAAFEQAVSAYRAASYIQAADLFRKAYRLDPAQWKLLYNIGQSEAAAKRHDLAHDAFEEYFAKGGDDLADDRKAEVMEELQRLQWLITFVEVQAPDGATVLVDNVVRGTTPLPGRLKIVAGIPHKIEIRKGDERLLLKDVKLSHGEITRIEAVAPQSVALQTETGDRDLQPDASDHQDPSLKDSERDEKEDKIKRMKIIGWTGIAAGGLSLIAAAATGGAALSIRGDLESKCVDNDCPTSMQDKNDTMRGLALSCDILTGTGIALAGVGIGLLVWSKRSERMNESNGNVSFAPIIGGTSAGIGIFGRF